MLPKVFLPISSPFIFCTSSCNQ